MRFLSHFIAGFLLTVALCPPPASAQTAEQFVQRSKQVYAVRDCKDPGNPDEIVVCGSGAASDRYRLPLPQEPEALPAYSRRLGDIPRANSEVAPLAPCGIFEGQRRCTKVESAEFGYGNGRDPISAALMVADALIDPD
jgi:hypothetical protein